MSRFKHLVFVCTHDRSTKNDPRSSCCQRDSAAFLKALKARVAEAGLKGKVRITASGCLDYCKKGGVALRLSEGEDEAWHTFLSPKDADDFFERYLASNSSASSKS